MGERMSGGPLLPALDALVQGDQGNAGLVSRVSGFTARDVTDGRLPAVAGFGNLFLRHTGVGEIGDDFFPVHASYYRNSASFVKRQTE